ncbi:MAG: hypothetical protein AAGF11_24130 [Myxococcota bacterium]
MTRSLLLSTAALVLCGAGFLSTAWAIGSGLETAVPASSAAVSLTVSSVSSNTVDLGNGFQEATIQAQGVLATSQGTTSTSLGLICLLDGNAKTLSCNGQITRGANSSMPIGLNYGHDEDDDSTSRYRTSTAALAEISNGLLFDRWYHELIVDIVPPDDGEGDSGSGTDGGGDGGGDGGDGGDGGGPGWPGLDDLIIEEPWAYREFSSDWTLILDGAVVSWNF